MTLDPAAFAIDLEDLLNSDPPTAQAAAEGLAECYFTYSSAAAFGASAPVIPPAKRDALAVVLLAVLSVPAAGSPASFAAAWASGLASYWAAVPVAGPQSGATAGCPGSVALPATLAPLLALHNLTKKQGAEGLANAIHTATLTVVANVAPPPGTVLPIL